MDRFMTFFTSCCTQIFFFSGESDCFHSIDCLFILGSQWEIHIQPIYKHFFFTCFSFHITHSSINFTWFALLSLQYYGRALSLSCGGLKVGERASTSAVINHWVHGSDDQKCHEPRSCRQNDLQSSSVIFHVLRYCFHW